MSQSKRSPRSPLPVVLCCGDTCFAAAVAAAMVAARGRSLSTACMEIDVAPFAALRLAADLDGADLVLTIDDIGELRPQLAVASGPSWVILIRPPTASPIESLTALDLPQVVDLEMARRLSPRATAILRSAP